MEKSKCSVKGLSLLVLLSLVFGPLLALRDVHAQQAATLKPDPKDPKRRIIVLPKINVRPAPIIKARENLLDSPGYRRAPMAFQKFEMVHPTTGKPLNPNAMIRLPDKKPISIKQYYDELNALEMEMNKRGRTLRDPAAFADLRPSLTQFRPPNPNRLRPAGMIKLAPGVFQQRADQMMKSSEPGSSGLIYIAGPITTVPLSLAFTPTLYVEDQDIGQGTVEFPNHYVVESKTKQYSRRRFKFLVEAPKGSEMTVKKFAWQISENPFSGSQFASGDNLNPPGLLKSGIVPAGDWFAVGDTGFTQVESKARPKSLYSRWELDFTPVTPVSDNAGKILYVRVIGLDASGKPVGLPSKSAIANYGGPPPPKFKVPSSQSLSGPPIKIKPDESSPFSFFVDGDGLQGTKSGFDGDASLGFKASAYARMGIRYFNFPSLLDSGQPKNKEFEILGASFSAQAGAVDNQTKTDANMSLTVFGQNVPVPVEKSQGAAGPDEITLSYALPPYTINVPVAHFYFLIGPVPITVDAALKGDLGLDANAIINGKTHSIRSTVHPYFHSRFEAFGGVDVFIAYAGVEANIEPLFNVDVFFGIDSSLTDPFSVMGSYSALKGRVSLVAGFYHPCSPAKQVKKLVGFITGDEDMPLCETKWSYNIFSFDVGVDDSFGNK